MPSTRFCNQYLDQLGIALKMYTVVSTPTCDVTIMLISKKTKDGNNRGDWLVYSANQLLFIES